MWAIIACLAVTYGALMFRPGAEFARTNLRTSPGLSYLYPIAFAVAALLVAVEIWQRSVEQKPTLPYWGVLVLVLGYTVPAGIWGDTAVFRPETTLGSMFGTGWLILQQLLQAFAALSLIHELPWKSQRRGLGSLRDGPRGLRSEASSRP